MGGKGGYRKGWQISSEPWKVFLKWLRNGAGYSGSRNQRKMTNLLNWILTTSSIFRTLNKEGAVFYVHLIFVQNLNKKRKEINLWRLVKEIPSWLWPKSSCFLHGCQPCAWAWRQGSRSCAWRWRVGKFYLRGHWGSMSGSIQAGSGEPATTINSFHNFGSNFLIFCSFLKIIALPAHCTRARAACCLDSAPRLEKERFQNIIWNCAHGAFNCWDPSWYFIICRTIWELVPVLYFFTFTCIE